MSHDTTSSDPAHGPSSVAVTPLSLVAMGVTGDSGRAFVAQALAAGHQVTALARRPDAVGLTHGRLQVHAASVTDPHALGEHLAGADAVVSALGVSGLLAARRGTDIYSASTRALLEAMPAAGVSRLVVVSSGGVVPQDGDGWFYRNVLKKHFLENIYRDMRVMESLLQQSALEWTVVRPPFLIGNSQRTDYRIVLDAPVPDDKTLSRWSLGNAMLRALEPEYRRHVMSVSL